MMQKVQFFEFAELKQGDGEGPKFYAGKAYWLSPDQAMRWKREGIADDAPADMPAENEPAVYLPAPDSVRIHKAGRRGYDVVGPGDHKFNDEPLSASEAELLRKAILAGEVKTPVPVAVIEAEMPALDDQEPDPEASAQDGDFANPPEAKE